MTVSIIIAVKTWQKNLEECVARCRELDWVDFQILVLPDQPLEGFVLGDNIPIIVIPTGVVSPAQKRDVALGHAKGDILAFIDDDVYPAKDWLKAAIKNFNEPEVAAVGGPAVTPPDDNLRQKASGAVYSSLLVSGSYASRYVPGSRREVDDYPSCNFLVRKSIMQELGGFNTSFWPGEDTLLCFQITKGLGKKIIYDPKVLVYHHRRPVFQAHLRQIASYALHRGYFVKRYPQTSLRIPYFIPSLFLLSLLGGEIIFWLYSPFRAIYLGGLSLYLMLVFLFSINKDMRLIALTFAGIILTHLTYGFYFLCGLIAPRLKEEL